MRNFPQTIVIRHRKENLKKCSLRGLEQRSDFLFLTYPLKVLPDLSEYMLLSMDAPPLTQEDNKKGFIILDGTWRYAAAMEKNLSFPLSIERRSLPFLRTAYPRRQEDCPSPDRGLASIEAIFTAYFLLGRDTNGLLDTYHWRTAFLEKNASLFASFFIPK